MERDLIAISAKCRDSTLCAESNQPTIKRRFWNNQGNLNMHEEFKDIKQLTKIKQKILTYQRQSGPYISGICFKCSSRNKTIPRQG